MKQIESLSSTVLCSLAWFFILQIRSFPFGTVFLVQTNWFSVQKRCHVGFRFNLSLFGLGPSSKGLRTNLKLLTNKIAWIHWSLDLGPASKVALSALSSLQLWLEWTSSHLCASSGWGCSSCFGDEPKTHPLPLTLPHNFPLLPLSPNFLLTPSLARESSWASVA